MGCFFVLFSGPTDQPARGIAITSAAARTKYDPTRTKVHCMRTASTAFLTEPLRKQR